ncbi:MAG: NigD-like protein [Tannerellaceae bacterium]|nr:NigD-like protein [Tannerellaceae bacterium]
MKKMKLFTMGVGLMLMTLIFNSCLDDDVYSLDHTWLSIATARPIDDNSFYLTLDDSTTLWPGAPLHINYQPTRPQRVQINYTKLSDNFQGYDHAIKLNRTDTIRTKSIAENFGAKNDSIYGVNPVEITAMWVGDGFLNVVFKTYFSGGITHFVNLIPQKAEGGNPYQLEFRHNAFNDQSDYLRYGLVAFDLSGLPSTEGKDVTLEIKTKTFNGEKVFEKKYNSGKNTGKEFRLSAENLEDII